MQPAPHTGSTPPLKRHAALVPLSRDHYVGLVQAQHLIRSADADEVQRRKVIREFLDAWDSDISVHFKDEERLLAALMDEPDRERMFQEHKTLRRIATEARERHRQVDPGADWVRKAGELLRDHIRWEERVAFGHIEQTVDPMMLAMLEEQTAMVEQSRSRGRGRRRPSPTDD